ncbi:MAG TPA: type II toxin-antitoxin system VapC family toxin [Candidatus Xenobia bacterium]|jgi:tRNA(fMet)-specific endonuclease VapC
MMRYLLDTNALSEPARPRPNARLLERWDRFGHQLSTASIVWHELWYGALRLSPGRRQEQLLAYLEDTIGPRVPVLPYDDRAAVWHAAERVRLVAVGRPMPFGDAQVAAVAKVNDLILVTANVRHYQYFDGLQIEDWTA